MKASGAGGRDSSRSPSAQAASKSPRRMCDIQAWPGSASPVDVLGLLVLVFVFVFVFVVLVSFVRVFGFVGVLVLVLVLVFLVFVVFVLFVGFAHLDGIVVVELVVAF